MAHAARVSAATDELVESVTRYSPSRNSRVLKVCKDTATKRLKYHRFGKTNHFNVKNTLDGLVEKFELVNREELAQALSERLERLDQISPKWKPETLSLLLHLSDNPVEKSSLANLPERQQEHRHAQLTWDEINAEDPSTEEGLWEDVDFALSSSEDEAQLDSQDESEPTQDTILSTQDAAVQGLILDGLVIKPDLKLLDQLQDSTDSVASGSQTGRKSIAELQAIKQILLMVQGLPSCLFRRDRRTKTVVVSGRHDLVGISHSTFSDLLTSMEETGTAVKKLKDFTAMEHSESVLQTFNSAVTLTLSAFMDQVSAIEERYIRRDHSLAVSVLSVVDQLLSAAGTVLPLSDVIAKAQLESEPKVLALLEDLYERTCDAHATDDRILFVQLGPIFCACVNEYMKAVQVWMDTGRLDVNDSVFFVVRNSQASEFDLTSFWQDRYAIRGGVANPMAPSFLRTFVTDIFESGKSTAFLDVLGRSPTSTPGEPLDFDNLTHDQERLFLLPFSEILHSSIQDWIRRKQSSTSHTLSAILVRDYGLLAHLEALATLYLSQDGSRSDVFANELFRLLSRGGDGSKSPLLIEDLAKLAFGPAEPVNERRIVASTHPHSNHLPKNKSRPLSSISFEYNIPWQMANIIQPTSIRTYQNVFSLILEIRRAKSHLIRQRLASTKSSNSALRHLGPDAIQTPTLAVRHRLFWFIGIIEEYVISMAIASSRQELRAQIDASTSVDGLIKAHSNFITSLKQRALLVENVSSLRDAVLAVLDLAALFATTWHDLALASSTNESAPLETTARQNEASGDTSGDESEDPDAAKRPRRPDAPWRDVSAATGHYKSCLRQIWRRYNELLSLLTAGLQSASRSKDGEPSWALLAEKLQWNDSRR